VPNHWGGGWRGYDDDGGVAAGVVPASGRWLPVVRNEALAVTYGTLCEAQEAAEVAEARLPPPERVRPLGRRRFVRNTGPEPVPHPGVLRKPPK